MAPLFLNKKFLNVQEKLKFIQNSCKEPELFPDLKQLFKQMGFCNVEITHGNTEYGKDLVFCDLDQRFKEEKWFGVIVKNKGASQNDFLPSGEIGVQISNAFSVPFKNSKGDEKIISTVIVVINGKVSGNATEIIKNHYNPVQKANIQVWPYQKLCEMIDENCKESFLNNIEPHISHYQSTQIKELSTIATNSLYDLNIKDINDIFVNVQTTYTKEANKVNNYVNFSQYDEKFYKKEDIEGSNEILDSHHNFIIHGIPTSGKTLFLKRIGIKALSNTSNNNAVFYIELDKINLKKFDIFKIIEEKYFEITSEKFKVEDYEKTVLLFDSIDFISDINLKEEILDKIEKFSSDKKYQVVIASRDLNFFKSKNLFSEFKETELLPFNFGQALQLVKKIIPDNELKTNSFLEAIKNNLLDSSIQKTPLALTLLAVLYRDDYVDLKELPANIFELYNKFTDIYLDRWDVSKGITQQYKYEQTKIIIALIALYIHSKGLNAIEIGDLRNYLTNLRTEYNYESLDNVDNFMDFLKTKNSVFYFDESTNTFQFFNHYFQEFFAALSLEDDEDEIFIDKFFDQWWHNSLIFYAGKKPKSFNIHKKIIERIFPVDLLQQFVYLSQHSKSLQASHSITIGQRESVVGKMLKHYDELFKTMIKDAKDNKDAFLNNFPYVGVINQSKNLFDEYFSSNFVSTKETLDYFAKALESPDLEIITRYNIAYFLADKTNDIFPLEYFAKLILNNSDEVWTRIVYVDTKFLNYKKTIDQKLLLKIKRKMNKNKFLIQYHLKNSIGINQKPIEIKSIQKSKIKQLRK